MLMLIKIEQNLAWENVALKSTLMQCRGWQISCCFLAPKPEVKGKDNNSSAGGGGKDNTNTQVLYRHWSLKCLLVYYTLPSRLY